jgi:hypothetical protein
MEVDPSTEPAQPHAEDNAVSQLLSSFPETPASAPARKPSARKVRLSGNKRPSSADSSLHPASPRHMVLRPPHKRMRSRLLSSSDGFSEHDDLHVPAGSNRHASKTQEEQVGVGC